ncbi:MAG: hypothetical protein Q9187_001871 [Circinaria calcarea]
MNNQDRLEVEPFIFVLRGKEPADQPLQVNISCSLDSRYGWGFLIVAGGGSYYFAKRSINADKRARHEAGMKRRRLIESLEHSGSTQPVHRRKELYRGADNASSPSTEASHDPAPTRHAPENAGQQANEKSKYEPSEPYRTKKGDRFS